MSTYNLTELQYSINTEGPWALYIYGEDGLHSGKQWFVREIRYPDEEISIAEAESQAIKAMWEHREIRVCDAGDMLVFHFDGRKIIHGEDFWKLIKSGSGKLQ